MNMQFVCCTFSGLVKTRWPEWEVARSEVDPLAHSAGKFGLSLFLSHFLSQTGKCCLARYRTGSQGGREGREVVVVVGECAAVRWWKEESWGRKGEGRGRRYEGRVRVVLKGRRNVVMLVLCWKLFLIVVPLLHFFDLGVFFSESDYFILDIYFWHNFFLFLYLPNIFSLSVHSLCYYSFYVDAMFS